MRHAVGRTFATASAAFLAAGVNLSVAQAQNSGAYASIGAGYATSNVDQIELVETGAGLLIFRGGYNLNRYFAIEGEGSFTVIRPDIDPTGVNGPDAALHHGQSFAGFLLARYPATQNIDVFVRGGYHHTRVTGRAENFRQTRSVDNFAFGGGAAYKWGHNSIRAEYTVYNFTAEHFDQRVASISFVRGF